MELFTLLKDLIAPVRKTVSFALIHSRLRRKHPTCKFYEGSFIDKASRVGSYNIFFKNVIFCDSKIENHSFIQKNSIIHNTDIGKFCSIASRVTIGLGQHPVSKVSTHPAFYNSSQPIAKTFSSEDKFIPIKRTTIGHDVWIGQNALIMDGVNIGTGSIIGAGAVVTKDVLAYSIVGGTPAKHIRYRFSEQIRKKLLASRWWEMSDGWFQENWKRFEDPESFLEYLETKA